jgi:nucleoside-diphosphate-sugar epimerase
MAKYLVTGAAGFIASRVSAFLLKDGHTIIGVDNLCDAYDVRLKHRRLANLTPLPGFTFQQMDIVDQSRVNDLFEIYGPFDGVINLAARAGVRLSVENPWVFVETNCTGTLNLLDACRRSGTKKFILSSTSSLYGQNNPLPYQEDANTDQPLSPYAASKKAAEAMCYTYHHLYGLDITVFRYFTVYGPAGRPDMSLFRFVQWIAEEKPVTIFGDGSQMRDFTYVDDIALGTIAGLRPLGYEIINLGNDQPHVLIDALHLIEEKVGKKANIIYKPMHKADVFATRASINRAERLLGWRPNVPLAEGISRLVEWYMAERSWAKSIITE